MSSELSDFREDDHGDCVKKPPPPPCWRWVFALIGALTFSVACLHKDELTTIVTTSQTFCPWQFCVAIACTCLLLLAALIAAGRCRTIENRLCAQRDLAMNLSVSRDTKHAAGCAIHAITRIRSVDACAIFLTDGKATRPHLIAHRGFSPYYVQALLSTPIDGSQLHQVLKGRTSFTSFNDIIPIIKPDRNKEVIKATALLPVRSNRKCLAILIVCSQSRQRFSSSTCLTLESIAARLGVVIARINAEKALAESSTTFREFVEGTHDLVCKISSKGRITYVNHTGERLFGMIAERLKGRFLWNFLHPDDRGRTRTALRKWVRQQRTHIQFENRIVDQSGIIHNMLWMIHLHYDNTGSVTSINAIGNDISSRKLIDKEILAITTQQQHRIGQDIHDTIGQNLTGIACLSKALEKTLTSKELAEAETAGNISKVAQEAARQCRSLAKGLCPVGLKVNGLTASLHEFTSHAENLFGIICTFNCDTDVHVHDDTAATQLFHIVQEAVTNAVKHGQAGRVDIHLTQKNSTTLIEIRDNGKGLPLETSSSAGMGMHIMGHRASVLGGSLDLVENPDGGTTVCCQFPGDIFSHSQEVSP